MAKPFYPYVKPGSYMGNPRKGYVPYVGRGGYTKQNHVWPPEPDPIWESVTGNPVSFETIKQWPLKQLSVAFSPKQDLHGYDSPWPAGGGANIWNEQTTFGFFNDSGVWTSRNDVLSSATAIPVTPSTSYYFVGLNSSYITFWKSAVTPADAPASEFISRQQVTSNTHAFTTPADCNYLFINLPAAYGTTYNHDVAINYPSSVTTYAPYSNICPILGWDSLTVEQRGKNLLDFSACSYVSSILVFGGAVTGGATKADGTLTLPAGSYTVSANASMSGLYVYDKDGTRKSLKYNSDFLTFTLTETMPVCIALYKSGTTAKADFEAFDIMLTLGNTVPETFTPYNPSSRSISISIGSTVYSGVLDVVTGVGESVPCYDLGTLNWSYFAQYDVFYTTDIKANGNNVDFMCSEYVKTSGSGGIGSLANGEGTYTVSALYLKNTNYTDAALFKASLNGVQFVAPSDTPAEIQLTPQEVNSLAGDNTLWSDANQPITVTYRQN